MNELHKLRRKFKNEQKENKAKLLAIVTAGILFLIITIIFSSLSGWLLVTIINFFGYSFKFAWWQYLLIGIVISMIFKTIRRK